MAQKFRDGDQNFPIIHENSRIRIYQNPNKEIFVEDILSGATLRLNACDYACRGIDFVAEGCHVEPMVTERGTVGWRVSLR